jgi:hypothetical protein
LESGTDERVLILILRSEVQCGVKGRRSSGVEEWRSGGVEWRGGGAVERKWCTETRSRVHTSRRNALVGAETMGYQYSTRARYLTCGRLLR